MASSISSECSSTLSLGEEEMTQSPWKKKMLNGAIDNSGSAIDKSGSAVDNPSSYVDNPGSSVDNPGSSVDNPGSAINNPGSAIDNPGSAIDNSVSLPNSGSDSILEGGGDLEDNSIPEGSSRLSLSTTEMNLPPWKQMLGNNAIDKASVCVSDSKDSTVPADDSDMEESFSDGELSEDNTGASNVCELKLRQYQVELAEKALLGDNTIILAPTGSGKTRVATHIIMEHFKQSDGREKKVAFLAKTVPLAVQQYKSLCKYLPHLQISSLTGQSEESSCLNILLKFNQIIVMTPQILENHLTKNLLPNLCIFTMLVFDECHHARKKDPYNVLMISYLKLKQEIKEKGEEVNHKLPQIIGLSATIGVGKAVDIKAATATILETCGNLDASSISTVQDHRDELKIVVPVPEEKFQKLTEREDDESVKSIHETMKKLEDQLKHYSDELRNMNCPLEILKNAPLSRKGQTYEQWAVDSKEKTKQIAIQDPSRETTMPVRLSIIILEYLLVYRAALETYDLVELNDVIDYMERCLLGFKNEEATVGEKTLYSFFEELKRLVMRRLHEENPNLLILAETLKRYLIKRGDNSRGIIFVRTRALAEALSAWLNRCGFTSLQNLNACSFTGSNASADKGGMTQAQQDAIVQRFKSGDVRVLVATSVAEEGLDIPECNLVVKYNHIGNEISVVQTRGRSRAFGGVSVLLAMDKILQRERINQERVKLMIEAIEKIQKIKPTKFKRIIDKHQKQILEEAKLEEMVASSKRRHYDSVSFRMVCTLCRKIAVDGTNVRTVSASHRISIDRNLLDHITIVKNKEEKRVRDCLIIGTVRCKGEPESGSECNRKLGYIVKHKTVPFITLGIKNFAFDLGDSQKLRTFPKWKDVPYYISELSFNDIERYLEDDRVLNSQNSDDSQNKEDDYDTSDDDSDD